MAKGHFSGTQNPGRRQALKKMAVGAGAAAAFPILGQARASAATPMTHSAAMPSPSPFPEANVPWTPLFFDAHQNEMVVALAELIIPATDTPGAKDAQVNRVIDLFLNEEEPDAQKRFLEGLAWIDGRAMTLHGKPFVGLTTAEQTALLEPLADPANQNPEDGPGMRFFVEIKDATLFGYYTSRVGMEQELHYSGGQYHDSFAGACTHPEHQS